MIHPALWQVIVQSQPEYEPVIATTLSRLFHLPASSYTAINPPLTTVSVYCPGQPGSSRAVATRIRQALAQLQPTGSPRLPCRILVRRLPARDWTSFWKRHFKPIVVGRALQVLPPWIKRNPAPGQKTLVLNPGLSFGTGHHPTTAFCLRQLARLRSPSLDQSFLDLGCGSGILAIAAAKLGYRPVEAIDTDPVAVRSAFSNARRNRVHHRVQIRQQDVRHLLLRPTARFAVLCANLSADVLLNQGPRIARQLAPGGELVLAGILAAEFPTVQRRFTSLGFKLTTEQDSGGWRSGRFQFLN